eukprot:5283448-Ditylum_brightwellii.AAC.1
MGKQDANNNENQIHAGLPLTNAAVGSENSHCNDIDNAIDGVSSKNNDTEELQDEDDVNNEGKHNLINAIVTL